jgi:hypothetical protein
MVHGENQKTNKMPYKNPEKQKEYFRNYLESHRDIAARNALSWHYKNRERHLEAIRKYRIDNIETIKQKDKEYRDAHKAQRRLYDKGRYYSLNTRIARSIRSRIFKALKGKSKSVATLTMVGCSLPELKCYLESMFQSGMSWDNYGYRGWHIDHIIPLSSFDLTDKHDIMRCTHFSNLRPMWALDNMRKGNRMA